MSAARIGKIRMKAGGAEVRVLRTDTSKASDQSEFVSTLLDVLRGAREGTVVGFAMVALRDDGESYYVGNAATVLDPDDKLSMLGAIRRLEHRFIAHNWEEAG